MTADRIEVFCEAIDAREDCVKAFVPGTLDTERIRRDAVRTPSGPLAGSLLGVKDIVNADGFPTRCGSSLPPERLGGPEASLVTRLRRAGAIVAGKTVTAEFAVSDPGPTCNPRNPAHTPGGSSSGSAAGVAAGFFDLAIGSQTGGSVIRPAAYCGVVGFKPTLGRVSTDGFFPYSTSIDHAGLFAPDIATLDQAMPVVDDAWTHRPVHSKQITLAIPEGPYLDVASSNALVHFRDVAAALDGNGLHVLSQDAFPAIDRHNDILDRLTYAELYRAHAAIRDEFWDAYQPLTRRGLEIGQAVTDRELEDLKAEARSIRAATRETMAKAGIDYWISPAAPDVAPKGLSSTGDHRLNSIWTLTGLPTVSIPSGLNPDGLPYGLQVTGRFGADEDVLAAAQVIGKRIGSVPIRNAWDAR